jgi:FtsP/CotA-like multicopper oxidase with cupredoxin domain
VPFVRFASNPALPAAITIGPRTIVNLSSCVQARSMLSGAFVVDSPGANNNDDRVFVVGTWVPVGGNAFNTLPTINGKSWPDTERLTLKVGEPIHWRWINTSDSDHAMNMHGFYFQVNGVGDQDHFQQFSPPDQLTVVTQELLPGGTFDTSWVPEQPGNWLMHCALLFSWEGFQD